MNTWHDGRPVFKRLPEVGYQDNPTADALTVWVDSRLSDKATQMQNLYKDLVNPDTAKPEYLNYLAYLVGLSGSYWDVKWSNQVKRKLIKNSHSFLWKNRGTFKALSFVLSAHSIKHMLWTDGEVILPFSLPATLGTAKLRFYIRLSIDYIRNGTEWLEAERTLRNYAPAITEHKVCYDYFRLGFSRLGEPMFTTDDPTYLTIGDQIATTQGNDVTVNP